MLVLSLEKTGRLKPAIHCRVVLKVSWKLSGFITLIRCYYVKTFSLEKPRRKELNLK